jgi:hypothetical protein
MGYEVVLGSDGTLALGVLFHLPQQREEQFMNFHDVIMIFSVFTTLRVPLQAIASADQAPDSAFFPHELDWPSGPAADFFVPQPKCKASSAEEEDSKASARSVSFAVINPTPTRPPPPRGMMDAAEAAHDQAMERLIHDDLDADFGCMDDLDDIALLPEVADMDPPSPPSPRMLLRAAASAAASQPALAMGAGVRFGLPVVTTRTFNHVLQGMIVITYVFLSQPVFLGWYGLCVLQFDCCG